MHAAEPMLEPTTRISELGELSLISLMIENIFRQVSNCDEASGQVRVRPTFW